MLRRLLTVAALVMTAAPLMASAQNAKLKLPDFEHLRARATDSVNITIGSWPLGLAAKFMDGTDPEDAEMKEVLRGLKAVYIRSYEFDSDFVYSESDIEMVRAQLSGPGWSPLMQVRKRNEHEAVDIYVALDGNKAKGLAIVASEPRQFTILNIVGTIDLDKLGRLEDRLGLPKLGVEAESLAQEDHDRDATDGT